MLRDGTRSPLVRWAFIGRRSRRASPCFRASEPVSTLPMVCCDSLCYPLYRLSARAELPQPEDAHDAPQPFSPAESTKLFQLLTGEKNRMLANVSLIRQSHAHDAGPHRHRRFFTTKSLRTIPPFLAFSSSNTTSSTVTSATASGSSKPACIQRTSSAPPTHKNSNSEKDLLLALAAAPGQSEPVMPSLVGCQSAGSCGASMRASAHSLRYRTVASFIP